ncbi:MAG TPA: SET domain-containing protein [Candidatus Deferrimicrobiaceae bacterium]|jgi:hypothetical protein
MIKNLKHQPLIGEILPGSLTVGLIAVSYFNIHRYELSLITKDTINGIFALTILFLSAWTTGTIYDAIRNGIVEDLLDRKNPISWDFFFKENIDKVHQIEEYYFCYYTLEINYLIGIFIFAVLHLPVLKYIGIPYIELSPLAIWAWMSLAIVFVVFAKDAKVLRKEMGKIINKVMGLEVEMGLPHTNSYTRLKPSTVHGVGVFAIRDIPEGTNVFADDKGNMVWVTTDKLEGLAPEIIKLFDDFCVLKENKYYCPDSFNNLTVGWYINHSKDKTNVKCTDDYDFIATKHIKIGDELLADYESYSDNLKNKILTDA